MILGLDGKYYFDNQNKFEFTYISFNEIKKQFSIASIFNKEKILKNINGEDFIFFMEKGLFCVAKKNNELHKTQLSFNPVKVIFYLKEKENPIDIFSFEQFERVIENLKISFPWSNDLFLTDENIKKCIYDLETKRIKIYDIEIFDLDINEPINYKDRKFKDLSKYISYYIKNNIKFDDYEEKKFINKDNYYLDPNSKYNCFNEKEKINLLNQLYYQIEQGEKEFFFTGPYSIGKTFSLLEYKINSIYNKLNKIAYFNLEALCNMDNYFEIIAYESRHLFENKDEWKNLFLTIKNLNVNGYFNIIIKLIELIIKIKSYNKDTKYIFIFDQIKFKNIEEDDYEFKKINEIRNIVKNNNNCYLIGCCSINYHGVKKMLFEKWFHSNDINNDSDNINIHYIKTLQSLKMTENKYLNTLGNLPRYRQFKDNIDSKYINIICKQIKRKFFKFYNNNKYLISYNLKKIEINKCLNDNEKFEKLLDNIPIKYFTIDKKKNMIDYSYPLINVVIQEILYTINLDNYYALNQSEKGWYFERKVIDEIKTTHILNDFYIDNYYQIKSIFFKEEINDINFDVKENSFFYFKYCNVRRYDCALYLGDLKILLLIQIGLYKDKDQIKSYNDNSFKKDIKSIQKFLKLNGIKVEKYSLLFIFNIDEYKFTDFEGIEKKGFQYNIYDLKKGLFVKKAKTYYQIKCEYNETDEDIENENDKIKFGKYNGNFEFSCKNDLFLYYIYKGMNLEDFFEQILPEVGSDYRTTFNLGKKSFYFRKVYYYDKKYTCDVNDFNNQEIFFITLHNYLIYFGNGEIKNPSMKIQFNSYDAFLRVLKENVEVEYLLGLVFIKA